MKNKITIATRESLLALWQAHYIENRLKEKYPGLTVELLPVTTKGDQILDRPLVEIGGKGLFIKELEVILLEGKADIAVHSLKDMTAQCPDGLTIAAVTAREDPRDAFVSNKYKSLEELPLHAKVGTSSLRRQAQLLHWRGDLSIGTLRGNVQTRLRHLDEGKFDAIILAAAGLKRLGLADRITSYISTDDIFRRLDRASWRWRQGVMIRRHSPSCLSFMMRMWHPAFVRNDPSWQRWAETVRCLPAFMPYRKGKVASTWKPLLHRLTGKSFTVAKLMAL